MFRINNAVKILGLAGCLLGLTQVFLACGSEEGSELSNTENNSVEAPVELSIRVLNEELTKNTQTEILNKLNAAKSDQIDNISVELHDDFNKDISFELVDSCEGPTITGSNYIECHRLENKTIKLTLESHWVTWIWSGQLEEYKTKWKTDEECVSVNSVKNEELNNNDADKNPKYVWHTLTCSNPTRAERAANVDNVTNPAQEADKENSDTTADVAECKLDDDTTGFKVRSGPCNPKKAGGLFCESDLQCLSDSCKRSAIWGHTCAAHEGPEFLTRPTADSAAEDNEEFIASRNKEIFNWIWSAPKGECQCTRADNWFGKVTCTGSGSQAQQEAACGGMFQIPIKPTQAD